MWQNDPNHLATGPSSSMSQMKHMQPHWRSQVRENLRYLRWRKTLHCFLSSFSRLWSRTILLRTGFYLPFAHVHPLASPTPLPEPDSCAHFCRLMRFAHSTHYRGTHGSATLPTHTSTLSAPPQPLQIILMATTACASRIPLIFDGLCPSSISSISSMGFAHLRYLRYLRYPLHRHHSRMAPPYGSATWLHHMAPPTPLPPPTRAHRGPGCAKRNSDGSANHSCAKRMCQSGRWTCSSMAVRSAQAGGSAMLPNDLNSLEVAYLRHPYALQLSWLRQLFHTSLNGKTFMVKPVGIPDGLTILQKVRIPFDCLLEIIKGVSTLTHLIMPYNKP